MVVLLDPNSQLMGQASTLEARLASVFALGREGRAYG